jgi:hypothetical protein
MRSSRRSIRRSGPSRRVGAEPWRSASVPRPGLRPIRTAGVGLGRVAGGRSWPAMPDVGPTAAARSPSRMPRPPALARGAGGPLGALGAAVRCVPSRRASSASPGTASGSGRPRPTRRPTQPRARGNRHAVECQRAARPRRAGRGTIARSRSHGQIGVGKRAGRDVVPPNLRPRVLGVERAGDVRARHRPYAASASVSMPRRRNSSAVGETIPSVRLAESVPSGLSNVWATTHEVGARILREHRPGVAARSDLLEDRLRRLEVGGDEAQDRAIEVARAHPHRRTRSPRRSAGHDRQD